MDNEIHDGTAESSSGLNKMPATGLERFAATVTYTLSIPERLIRSSVAAVGGLVKELSERLVPQVLQDTQLFQAFVARTNRFVLERLAGVEGLYSEPDANQAGFASRKALSNAIEVGSLMTLHLSPLLVLAAASDVMKGGRAVLKTIVDDLRDEGIIKESATVDNFDGLLESMHEFTSHLALQAELPPLSKEELLAVGANIRRDVEQMRQRKVLSQEQYEQLAADLHNAVKKNERSLWQMSSALAHGSAHSLVKSAQVVISAGGSGIRIFDDRIIDFYSEQLGLLVHEGLPAYFTRVSIPYYAAMRKTWDNKTYTWTEAFLHGLSNKA